MPTDEERRKHFIRTAFLSVCGGTAGGVVGKIVEFPLDTIKVRLQTGTLASTGRPLTGPWDCFKDILKSEGPYGFYKGLLSPVFGAGFETAVLFFAYGQAKLFLCKSFEEAHDPPYSKAFLAGVFSGIWTGILLTPIELVKCKLQVQLLTSQTRFTGSVDCVRYIWRTEGLSGLFRGLQGTMARELPGNGLWFSTYVTVFRALRENTNLGHISRAMLSGCCAGVVYWAVPYPLDAVKSRMQTATGISVPFRQTARSIYAEGGIPAFYRGIGITLLRAAPTSASIFATDHIVEREMEKYLFHLKILD